MIWQSTPYAIPVIIGAFLSVVTALFVWRRGGPQTTISLVILLSAVEWLLAYALELSLAGMAAKVFWNKMQYVGGTILATGLLVLALQAVGNEKWVTRRNIILINIVPIICLIFVFTNEYHGLVWPEHYLIQKNGYIWLDHPHGIVYWLYVTYLQLLVLINISLMVWAIFQSQHYYRRQAALILLGLLLPFIVSLVQSLGFRLWEPLNLIQMSYVLAIVPVIWGLFRLHIGDLIPVARAAVFDGIDDCVIVLDDRLRIIDVNDTALALFQRRARELVGESIDHVWPNGRFSQKVVLPDKSPGMRREHQFQQARQSREVGQEVVLGSDKNTRIYDMRISSLFDWRGAIMTYIIVMRDISQRVQTEKALQKVNQQLSYELGERLKAERQIKESLTEKEILLKEIHHRVKNNLQVISSMLNLQSSYVADAPSLSIFQDSQNRVRSMALIHEKLYQSENLAQIDFHDYVLNLASYLASSYRAPGVHILVDGESISLEVDTAVSCGLILNELISNALKHAFPDNRAGQITITLQQKTPGQIYMSVVDDGVGPPPDLDINQSPTLGLQLVHTLVDQLAGTIQINRSVGMQFHITCPLKKSN